MMRTSVVQRWAAVLGLLAAIFVLPSFAGRGRVELGHPIKFTERDWVELAFSSFLRDLHRENLVVVMLHFSERFADEKGRNKKKAREVLERFFAGYEGVKGRAVIRMSDFEIDVQGDRATVACRLTIRCTRTRDRAVFRTPTISETVKLAKEKGSWKIVGLEKLLSSIENLKHHRQSQSVKQSK
jgi:hypothetical protein